MRIRCRRGFSRLEACITFLVLAVIAALVVPAIQQAREAARRSVCENTLKQLALTLHNYHDVMRSFPHGCAGNGALLPEKRWSWYPCIGTYSGHYGTPETHSDGQPYTDYVGTAGIAPDAAFLARTSRRAGIWSCIDCRSFHDVADGTSTTVFVIETQHDNGCWLAGGPATVRGYNSTQKPIGAAGQFGGLHKGGSMTAFVDGHVQFLAETIDPQLLSGLVTIAGSESIPDNVRDTR